MQVHAFKAKASPSQLEVGIVCDRVPMCCYSILCGKLESEEGFRV
jgi:hypothetical protein